MPRHLKHTAAEWFVRSLSETFTDEERERLQDWLADDPEHIRAYNEARGTWQAMEGLKNDPDFSVGPASADHGGGGLKSALRGTWKTGMAAAAVVVIGLALAWQLGLFDDGVYTTEPWEHRTIMLSDGSTVMLSANTVVEDTSGERRRGAVVHRGEAIFDVVTDKTDPFIVRVADAEIVVTGTRFQVRNDEGKVAVTLIEGRVRVERAPLPPAAEQSGASNEALPLPSRERAGERGPQTTGHKPQATVLQPGQQLAFAETAETAEVREVDVEAVTAWSRNRLVFRDAPLAEALREANRHADLKLILEDPTLADVRVNGHFRLGDTKSLLAAIRGSFPIQAYRLDKDEIVLTRAR